MSCFYFHREIFNRFLIFGENKNKLALLLFSEQILQTADSNINDSIFMKKIIVEISDENLEQIETIYNQIKEIKSKSNFENLSMFLENVARHIELMENKDSLDSSILSKSLSSLSCATFYKQDERVIKLNLLNFKEINFIQRISDLIEVI
jgi:hypothetical protein